LIEHNPIPLVNLKVLQ